MGIQKFYALALVLLVSACATSSVGRLPANLKDINYPPLNKTADDFNAYIAGYNTPELFQDNEEALLARLKLLDQVPRGGHVRVMTFVHDNGHATKLLAGHLCLAAKRGVKVEYTADSKSGDRVGHEDVFDLNTDNRVNEELYQMLSNCGVDVRIHNHIAEFSTSQFVAAGTRIPMITESWQAKFWGGVVGAVTDKGEQAKRGRALLSMGSAAYNVASEYFSNPELAKGILSKEEIEAVTQYAKTTVWELVKVYFSIPEEGPNGEPIPKPMTILRHLQDVIEKLSKEKLTVIREQKSEAVRKIVFGFVKALYTDPDVGPFYKRSREFHRLNHRKLFHVEYGDKACMFVGGRNLGDHYLTWGRHGDEFMDADVLYCSHHGGDGPTKAAAASFRQIFENEDQYDPLGVPHVMTKYSPDYNFAFKYLKYPQEREAQWVYVPWDEVGQEWHWPKFSDANKYKIDGYPDERRYLQKPIEWADNGNIRGLAIADSSAWRVKTSTWDRSADEVRKELYSAIDREAERIYIETAYAEMNSTMRKKLENALKRGVSVEIVTNSISVSDGGSKGIRLMMARWFNRRFQNLEKYRGAFNVRYATLAHGHMIHVKGASFACQAPPDGRTAFRLNLVGSHNFHGRSGYSDKEHAIIWQQPPKQSCIDRVGADVRTSEAKDFRDMRNDWYAALQSKVHSASRKVDIPVLKTYESLGREMIEALATKKLTGTRKQFAELLLKFVYQSEIGQDGTIHLPTDTEGRKRLQAQEQLVLLLEILSDVGLSDLFGTLL